VPTIVKLSPEEATTERNKGKSQRRLVNEQYDAMLSAFEIGDWGDVTLDESDKRTTVRNRLKAAAERRGVGLNFRRSNGEGMRFQLVERGQEQDETAPPVEEAEQPVAEAPIPEPEPEPVGSDEPPVPPKRRGGRPKKQLVREPVVE
jgi:hypothetical protein